MMHRVGRGFTLLEVLVTLALMGLLLGLVAVAGPSLQPPPEAEVPRRIAAAREEAVRTRAPVTVTFDDSTTVSLFPDGSATPASVHDQGTVWVVDPWTAEVRHE